MPAVAAFKDFSSFSIYPGHVFILSVFRIKNFDFSSYIISYVVVGRNQFLHGETSGHPDRPDDLALVVEGLPNEEIHHPMRRTSLVKTKMRTKRTMRMKMTKMMKKSTKRKNVPQCVTSLPNWQRLSTRRSRTPAVVVFLP
jgi:hypothetical protein